MGAFKTKARAVELLGRKQIRDSVTALAEIMKNSYDADAKLLRVEFLTKDVETPCIVICDTGVGMDKEDLEDKWLVLGTPSKLENPKKESPGGRPLMGAKGIGRLAISRLGQQMWMFTKKSNTDWNILYINWNIFENQELYIEDVNIPVVYNKKWQEVPDEIKKLRNVQLENLKNNSWSIPKNIKKRELIRNQIKEIKLEEGLVDDVCAIIEDSDIKQGTVIFSLDLNDDWERYLDPDISSDDDMFAARYYNRLNSFMTDFGGNEKEFQVELFHNGDPLVFSQGFTQEDYEIYDLKIEGYVEHGSFKGKIDARNADRMVLEQCNQALKEGISVTAGIKNWENDDCGRYSVKLCHFEMDKKNTGLTEGELDTIKRRMEKAGGIGVYRDNVRVLPYGEPDNDFLELEERRSRSATYYLFSHRNMFGRIDIASSDNPYLEDKSSREGFIENQYYNYFIRTLQNLLMRISIDFLGDMNKNSFMLRQTYLRYNNEKKLEQEKIRDFEKEQERLFKEDYAKVRKLLRDNPVSLKDFEKNIHEQIKHFRETNMDENTYYKALLENESRIKSFRHEMEGDVSGKQKTLHIYIDEKFESKYDAKTLERVDAFNEELDDAIQELKYYLYTTCDQLQKSNQLKIKMHQDNFRKQTGNDMETVMCDLHDYLQKTQDLLRRLVEEMKDDTEYRFGQLMQKVQNVRDHKENILAFRQEINKVIEKDLCSIAPNLSKLEVNISDPGSPEELMDVQNKISQEEAAIYCVAEQISEKIIWKFADLNSKLDVVLCRFETDDAMLIRQLTTRNNELKQLNEMYADLANLGMAAEIVSHELNQLFNNVYDAINQLRFQGLSANGKYYLKQIDVGFRAISDRMSQMSPMYRSKSMYKKKVNIYEMLEGLRDFFRSRLDKQNVRFVNEVPQELELKLSLSKIYPVISNLIYNSLYWVADKKNKEILFRYVGEENALYVEDSGEGIPIRNKERIFEPFFSLKKNGRGLGLTISKNVMESQGYEIAVVTEPEKKCLEGACFKISFGLEEGEK